MDGWLFFSSSFYLPWFMCSNHVMMRKMKAQTAVVTIHADFSWWKSGMYNSKENSCLLLIFCLFLESTLYCTLNAGYKKKIKIYMIAAVAKWYVCMWRLTFRKTDLRRRAPVAPKAVVGFAAHLNKVQAAGAQAENVEQLLLASHVSLNTCNTVGFFKKMHLDKIQNYWNLSFLHHPANIQIKTIPATICAFCAWRR